MAQGKQYEGLVTFYLEALWGFGGDWIDPDTRAVLLDSPEALKALEFLKKTLGTISPRAVTTYIEEDTRSLFQSGRSIFLRNWPYVLTLINNLSIHDGEDNDLAELLAFSGGPDGPVKGEHHGKARLPTARLSDSWCRGAGSGTGVATLAGNDLSMLFLSLEGEIML